MKSRPNRPFPKKNTPRNSVSVLAISPNCNTHVYPSISAFVKDVTSLGKSKRKTASRRIADGGGNIGKWYVESNRIRATYHQCDK